MQSRISANLRRVRDLLYDGDDEQARNIAMETLEAIEQLEIQQEFRVAKEDVYYHLFMISQVEMDVVESLRYLIYSYIEETLTLGEQVEWEDTRAGRCLRKLFKATPGFFDKVNGLEKPYLAAHESVPVHSIYEEVRKEGLLETKYQSVTDFKHMTQAFTDRQEELKKQLQGPDAPEHDDKFVLFKRWNSVDCRYPQESGAMGGGYFLFWKGSGIAIDPGYDYVRQFFDSGRFTLGQINAIVVTHAHDDHSHDVETIYSLFSKYQRASSNLVKLPVFYGSEAAVMKYARLLETIGTERVVLESHTNTTPLLDSKQALSTQDRSWKQLQPEMRMKWLGTIHTEIPWMTNNTGVALKFELGSRSRSFKLGITGDTRFWTGKGKYYQELKEFLRGCKLLVVHVGAPSRSMHHMELIPAAKLITEVKPNLAVLSEFGLDFDRGRRKVAEFFVQGKVASNTQVLAGDSGLAIKIPEMHILTSHGKWVPYSKIESKIRTEKQAVEDEAIVYDEA